VAEKGLCHSGHIRIWTYGAAVQRRRNSVIVTWGRRLSYIAALHFFRNFR